MATIKFYVNNDADIKVNKMLGGVMSTVSFHFLDNVDILHPSIILQTNDNYITTYNYAYIDDLKRYYFIRKITVLKGGMVKIDMDVDVLYTYQDAIKNTTCYIERAKNGNVWLHDGLLPISTKREIMIRKFPNKHFTNTLKNVIIVTGGDQNE